MAKKRYLLVRPVGRQLTKKQAVIADKAIALAVKKNPTNIIRAIRTVVDKCSGITEATLQTRYYGKYGKGRMNPDGTQKVKGIRSKQFLFATQSEYGVSINNKISNQPLVSLQDMPVEHKIAWFDLITSKH